MDNRYLFTSESVTEGHPDKIADQISDAILDNIINQDPYGRVAVETLVATGLVLVAGQVTTSCYVDIPRVIRKTIREIGYTRAKYGFDADTCAVITSIDEQAKDIDGGVSKSLEARMGEEGASLIGAGDQGMMFGYACNETPELMPLPIMLAHRLVYRLTWLRKEKILPYLRPDGKSQVTVEYENGIPKKVTAIVIVAQHSPDVSNETLKKDIKEKVINYVIPQKYLDPYTKYFINTAGRFVEGGPKADTGLTGRKIIVDTYGGTGRHGGGCFSGKDPTKVDRSGSYAARYVAKNIVAAGLADKCEVQIAYAIGVAHPVSIMVDTFGTGKIPNSKIITLIKENFDLQPEAIINHLKLRRPIYKKTAAYGHFGRKDKDFTWEKTDKAEILKNAVYHISTPVPPTLNSEKKINKTENFIKNDNLDLNPKCTFDNFVVRNGNRFTHAACLAVAQSPGKVYNPLFIYGSDSLDSEKNHLMQAICNYIIQHNPKARILYVSGAKFTNEWINSIRDDRTVSFRDKYRSVDILLIDDIQVLAGKERTQEEFFHTFNTLYESNKQIVITSDRPPKDIVNLEERLLSRFEWGLTTDIQAPDYETRIAILRKKAQSENLNVPDEIIDFIALKITSNIRKLEEVLTKLNAYSTLTKKELSISLVQEILKDIIP